jgi:3-oxoacyl-[acyl-carrier protein] reductase
MEINSSVAVVTGGASGIGAAVGRYFASRGARVVLGDIDGNGAEGVARHIHAAGGDAVACTVDVTDESAVAACMDLAVSRYGAINVVVPCAGIIRDGLFLSPDRESGKVTRFMSTGDFRAVVDVNLVGTFITLREAAVRMVNNRWGGVLFTISSVQKAGGVGQLNYSSTKAALAMWPKVLVGEFAMRGVTGIRVNSIAPGYVGTSMVRNMDQKALDRIVSNVHIGRLIEPEEIARTIGMITENDAIDGSTVEVTGGLISGMIAK